MRPGRAHADRVVVNLVALAACKVARLQSSAVKRRRARRIAGTAGVRRLARRSSSLRIVDTALAVALLATLYRTTCGARWPAGTGGIVPRYRVSARMGEE